MSRIVPYLAELQPAMFCEVSPELAAEAGLEHGGWATIYSPRAAIEARVLVTDRIPPLEVQGRTTHQVGLPVPLGHARPDDRRRRERPLLDRARPERAHPGGQGVHLRISPAGGRAAGAAAVRRRDERSARQLRPTAQERVGFFTDTSVCIGCKACEVACKEWNLVPEDGLVWTGESYDNTSELGANTWRHVAFIEQNRAAARSTGDGERATRCAG